MMRNFIDSILGKRILVVGDLMLDIHLRGRAVKISPEAPVPVVMADSRSFTPGGAANVMKNLHSLGCSVYGAGFVGADVEGDILLKALDEEKINTESVVRSSLSTIYKTRVVADGQHIVRFDFDSYFGDIKEEQDYLISSIETMAIVRKFDAIIISDYCKGTITQEVANKIIDHFSCPVIVDSKPEHKHYFSNTWCITPNLIEAQQMVGPAGKEMSPIKLATTLKEEMSLKSVIITMADQGIFCLDENNKSSVYPAHVELHAHDSKQLFDVTGAGDTVISVFTACLIAGASTLEAVYAANIAAGIVVRKPGTASCSLRELLSEIE